MATKEQSSPLQFWLAQIKDYEREFKKWESRADKILKRYRDDGRSTTSDNAVAKFNILWSNVQVLIPACFSRTPRPDVSRRFRDNDPVGRVASLLLERGLEFEIQHYPDYRSGLRNAVQDKFLGGRGTAWVRYEPHFRAAEQQLPEDGAQVTEDVDEAENQPDEVLDYECAPVDYVNWKDFGHTVARTWEEVRAVWRQVYMDRAALVERFGEKLGNEIPLDTEPEDAKKSGRAEAADKYQALIFEIWDKQDKRALWISKSLNEIIDERDDPLKLDGFFPCPRPLYATLTTQSLVPVPDFTLYQDQANSLDVLCGRIDGLVNALQVKGVYNSAIPELGRLFTEAENNSMIPVKDWMSFSEKMGLRGSIDLVELKPIYEALTEAYKAMTQVKQQIYEIMGIADIVRGASNPNETLGAQQIKGQFVSLRLKTSQQDVAEFATSLLQIKAQIMCNLYAPETLLKIASAEQLDPFDQQMIPQALELLKQNTLRDFRVEVAADSMVEIDEKQEKKDRMELIGAVASFLEKALPAAQMAPQITPLLMEMLKFTFTAFKAGRLIEGKIDQFSDQMAKMAAQPRPPKPPDPRLEVEKIKAQAVQAKTQSEMALQPMRNQADQMRTQADVMTAQAEVEKARIMASQPMMGQQPMGPRQ